MQIFLYPRREPVLRLLVQSFVLLGNTNDQTRLRPIRMNIHIIKARVAGNAPGRLAASTLQPAIGQVRLANQGTAQRNQIHFTMANDLFQPLDIPVAATRITGILS
jgi:hypothetical protein